MINWAVCVPSTCTPNDIQNSLKEYVQNFTAGTGVQVKIRVDPQMCHVKNTKPYEKYTIWTGYIAGFLSLSFNINYNDSIFQCIFYGSNRLVTDINSYRLQI